MSERDPSRVLTFLAQRGLSVDLKTLDLCFLAALYLRAERSAVSSFTEEQLVDVFTEVTRSIASEAEPAKSRATPAIRRLREQRMLSRVDGAGVVRTGEFALSRLAVGIVEYFLEEEALTRESLTLLLRSLLAQLAEVRGAARNAATAAAWRDAVIGPLKVTVSELVGGIERRQCGFDAQQEEFQREIGALLATDWFGAVERCQALLESTSQTLRELNDVLLRDTSQLQSALQDIQEIAAAAQRADAEAAARNVMEQIDRIAGWGAARQRAWSEYFQYVHRFLRDVVRLDPSRLLTQRLRELMTGKNARPFALAVATDPPLRLLRPIDAPMERPPVRRPRKERETEVVEKNVDDPQGALETRVQDALAGGARSLLDVTAALTAELAPDERFLEAGRIAHAVARLARAEARAERPWVLAEDGLELEQWSIRRVEGAS